MGYKLCGFPPELYRKFDEEILIIFDPDYFPRGIKVNRLLQMHAPELFETFEKAGWEVWAVPTEAAFR